MDTLRMIRRLQFAKILVETGKLSSVLPVLILIWDPHNCLKQHLAVEDLSALPLILLLLITSHLLLQVLVVRVFSIRILITTVMIFLMLLLWVQKKTAVVTVLAPLVVMLGLTPGEHVTLRVRLAMIEGIPLDYGLEQWLRVLLVRINKLCPQLIVNHPHNYRRHLLQLLL
jgi:hypothetical protein